MKKLIELIENSYSLDKEEKKEFLKILPEMDKEKKKKLMIILQEEKNEIDNIETEYNENIEDRNRKIIENYNLTL